MTKALAGTRRSAGGLVLAAMMLLSLGVSFDAIVPPAAGGALVVVFAWVTWPGIVIARRLYGSTPHAWTAALLAGPTWGIAFTSIVLLVMWAGGVRSVALLAAAPLVVLPFAIPAGRLARWIAPPQFSRRDLAPLILVLALVPVVTGRPFARVGEMRPEGKAYRAYFIADFQWAMAVVSELSKGDVPPRNPFLAGDVLHYYWLADLLSAIEHRATRSRLAMESILLANAMLFDLAFVAFLYIFVRQFVHSPPAAAIACIAAVLLTSFEGTQQLYVFWQRGIPLDGLRTLNIDAISNWKFGALKVDGLHRVLLYQPQHATAWAVSLSAVLVLLQARDNGRFGINAFAGLLLAAALLVSSFIAVMVGIVVAIYQTVTLATRRHWKSLVVGGVAGAVPVGLAVLVTNLLHYVDRSDGQIVYVGSLNPVAATRPWLGIFLSFGPMLIAAAAGALTGLWRRASQLAVLGLIVAVGFFFYFFVDVVDHQHAYVGWRAGHLLFLAFAPLAGFAWQELWGAGGRTRTATTVVATLVALAAAPMTVIDFYNTQDTDNQGQGPGFKWTEIVTPDELQALDWIKAYTPEDALIQVDPLRESGTWAYMPAFGERRMTAGTPISMIPIRKYQEASERVKRVFAATDVAQAYADAGALKLQYLFVGPRERKAYPQLGALLDAAPFWFNPVFRNGTVTIYKVT